MVLHLVPFLQKQYFRYLLFSNQDRSVATEVKLSFHKTKKKNRLYNKNKTVLFYIKQLFIIAAVLQLIHKKQPKWEALVHFLSLQHCFSSCYKNKIQSQSSSYNFENYSLDFFSFFIKLFQVNSLKSF